jgi:hypothetical protein
MKSLTPSLFLALALGAVAQAQGVSAVWDVSKSVGDLAQQAARLNPILDELKPEQWEAQGAPPAYAAQLRSAREELGYLLRSAEALGKQPAKLTLALDTLFRLQSVEAQVTSLVAGVRRYQNPAIGDLLESVLAANYANRDQLRQYVTDLAETKEQEYKIVDQEAQRCRGDLARQPVRPQAAAPKPAMANKPVQTK